jgi:hypothetical protein
MNANREAAEHTGKRITESTKQNYVSKLNILRVYLSTSEHAETALGEDRSIEIHNMVVEDQEAILLEFFGYLSTNTEMARRGRRRRQDAVDENAMEDMMVEEEVNVMEIDVARDQENDEEVNAQPERFAENIATISVSGMQAFKSAIKWYYDERKANWSKQINDKLDLFIRGYKKTVATKKTRGVMSVQEGKSRLSFTGYIEM